MNDHRVRQRRTARDSQTGFMTPETTTDPGQLGRDQRKLTHEMDSWNPYEALAVVGSDTAALH